ncbi:DUF3902 family protein [Bacillus thuringiensis]|uniref:DUF3902 family protein n=1 Tax=Bacillus thuringiensis TaxID=1428 RepID=UPI002DC0A4DB|nr:DUF3902 family protein [Bacillus thuringiensis]MED2063357.1 DUF3902 family protein [Bacillus thuringiensis]
MRTTGISFSFGVLGIALIILMFQYINNKFCIGLFKRLILLNLFLTLGPVFYPLFLTFLGNGMNTSAGW